MKSTNPQPGDMVLLLEGLRVRKAVLKGRTPRGESLSRDIAVEVFSLLGRVLRFWLPDGEGGREVWEVIPLVWPDTYGVRSLTPLEALSWSNQWEDKS